MGATAKTSYMVHLIAANGELSEVLIPSVTWKGLKVAARRIAAERGVEIHYTERASVK